MRLAVGPVARIAGRRRFVLLGLLGCLALAACGGSQLDPAAVRAANVSAMAAGAASATGADVAPPTEPETPLPPANGPAPVAVAPGVAPVGAVPGTAVNPVGHPGATTAASVGAASCSGLRNQAGVTDSTITIANASDITGPVPGIFTSAQQATAAFAAYFNATGGLCGRTLQVLDLDTRTDAGGDQQAALIACQRAFAEVGSMSAFDSGGAGAAEHCGLPDIRSQSVSDARNACATCFGAQATEVHAFQNGVPDFLLATHHAAALHAAMVYVGEAASVETAKWTMTDEQRRGMHFVYSTSFDVAEFNYAPYVQALKDHGVGLVEFIGSPDEAVRFANAMLDARFHPDAFVLDPTDYNPQFLAAGAAVEGALVYLDFLPFEEASRSPEMRLYEQWLQQVAPGAVPTYFGLFSWSAARLFAEQAQALGGQLTRSALVRRLRQVDAWTDHGVHGPQPVGPKRNSSCWRFVTARHGHWVLAGNDEYLCHGSTGGAG